MHASTCRSHGFDLIPLGFSTFGSFGPEAEALLSLFTSVSARMFKSRIGRLVIEYFAVFLSPLCVVFQSS